MPMMKMTTLPQRGSLDYSPRGAVQSTVPHRASVEHRGVVQTTVPQKGRPQCPRGATQSTVPRGAVQNTALEGQCRAHCPRRVGPEKKGKIWAVQNTLTKRGTAKPEKMTVDA